MITPVTPDEFLEWAGLIEFLTESNAIEEEGPPNQHQIDAAEAFLALETITVADMCSLVDAIAPGAKLRDKPGMDVRVGSYKPPRGHPEIKDRLERFLRSLGKGPESSSTAWGAYAGHGFYESIHPFMDGNGRSGRLLWLWQMGGVEKAPRGFLLHHYMQSLEAGR